MDHSVRITGLHRLPFDERKFESDCNMLAGRTDEAELRAQLRECWDNAWIVVIETDATFEEIDFGDFQHPEPGPSAQTAWMEQQLPRSAGGCRAAFFLHYVDPACPLYFGSTPLTLPAITSAPTEILSQIEYASPD